MEGSKKVADLQMVVVLRDRGKSKDRHWKGGKVVVNLMAKTSDDGEEV